MTYPARIVKTDDEVITEDQLFRNPLGANTRVAVRLAAQQLRPHLHIYVVHRASDGGQITVIGYVQTATLGPRSDAALRVPQRGAWLLCPTEGEVFVVPSDKLLTHKELSALPGGGPAGAITAEAEALDFVVIEAAPPPVGGDKTAREDPDDITT